MSQTFLDENPPMILDATCSYSRRWPNHATFRIDIRPEVHPDFVMDAKELKFPDAFFDEIYCDPPHMIRANLNVESIKKSRRLKGYKWGNHDMFDRYGLWNSRADWLGFLRATNWEFHRCLKLTGLLHYKLCVGRKDNVTLAELLEEMTSFTIIDTKVRPSKTNVSFSKSRVYFLTMKPKAVESK
jgi:tRNA G10  N-methylase Trm11